MVEHVNGNVKYLSFKSLDELEIVTNAFSTRIGGVSKDCFATMNLGFTNGDEVADVNRNYELFADAIGVRLDHMVRSKQTHTTNIKVVSEADCRNDGILPEITYTDIDGLITNVPGIALTTFYADCVPLYFVDPVEKVIGLAHSGWRGTVKRMGECTIRKMSEEFGCKPENIKCCIGPSICQKCYEVSEDVAEEFYKEFGNDSKNFILEGKRKGKYQLDLWEANKTIFVQAGIKIENIESSNICTCENSTWLFSHRASNGKRGNLAAVLMLNTQD